MTPIFLNSHVIYVHVSTVHVLKIANVLREGFSTPAVGEHSIAAAPHVRRSPSRSFASTHEGRRGEKEKELGLHKELIIDGGTQTT
jgi:hypothetical protein